MAAVARLARAARLERLERFIQVPGLSFYENPSSLSSLSPNLSARSIVVVIHSRRFTRIFRLGGDLRRTIRSEKRTDLTESMVMIGAFGGDLRRLIGETPLFCEYEACTGVVRRVYLPLGQFTVYGLRWRFIPPAPARAFSTHSPPLILTLSIVNKVN